MMHSVHEDVAATDLRERLRRGASCADLLPDSVVAYIAEHRLYR
jgi:nicotinic acid mononucleotide adenylyltransferase